MTLEKALQTAFAKSSEKLMKLPMRVPEQLHKRFSGAEIAETLPDHALLLLTEGPAEGTGLAIIAPDALACLIEVMTSGRLAAQPPEPRRPTRTDATVVSTFLDMVLEEVEILVAEMPEVVWLGGFSFRSHLPDPRPLSLILDEPAYQTIRLSLAFGQPTSPDDAPRTGEITLVFPAKGRGAPPQAAGPAPGKAETMPNLVANDGWQDSLGKVVQQVQAEVQAVLARVTLPLSDILKLQEGMSLPIPAAALSMVRVEGEDGKLICQAQLGQGNGHRALRIYISEEGDELPALPTGPTEIVLAKDQPLTQPNLHPEDSLVLDRTAAASTRRGDDPAGEQVSDANGEVEEGDRHVRSEQTEEAAAMAS
ncbi:MAG: FliM/FliN family flagellar motor switch protein [Paracoccaceae bacterium]